MSIIRLIDADLTKCKNTYIFNISIGSGSTRLSRLDDVSESGSFRSSNAIDRSIIGPISLFAILTVSHEDSQGDIEVRLSHTLTRFHWDVLEVFGTKVNHLNRHMLTIES